LAKLGIGIVAYSPLGRGFHAGTFEKREDLDDKDWRLQNPRFSEEHFAVNAAAIAPFKDLCQAKAVPAAQMALAWVHAQGADIFPIPGTKHVNYIRQNVLQLARLWACASQERRRALSRNASDLCVFIF
jgi:aryl-alcohol dehydrogenase-like predicted oxidoreductase